MAISLDSIELDRKDGSLETEQISLNDPKLYINREVSWIRFNYRILEEAKDLSHPLLERVKFLAICGSNLDEFFMTRVSRMQKKIKIGDVSRNPDGMSAFDELEATRREIIPLLKKHHSCWSDEIKPALASENIHIRQLKDINKEARLNLRDYFEKKIFPIIEEPNEVFAHIFIPNLRINLFVLVKDKNLKERYFLVEVPNQQFPRFVPIKSKSDTSKMNKGKRKIEYVFLEDVIIDNLDILLPEMEIVAAYPFRLTRNAEIEILVDETSDFLKIMQKSLKSRKTGIPIRLEVDDSMPDNLREILANMLGLQSYFTYEIDNPLGFVDFWQLFKINRSDLKDTTFHRYIPKQLSPNKDLFKAIKKKDYIFYYPYDNFEIILNLMRHAAKDPYVTSIYITLYRIDKKSPITNILMDAAKNGKKVTAFIELKAKFDEEHNIEITKKIKSAGVNVIYNFPKLKIHAKILLIERKKDKKIIRFSNIGSGNYNAFTTRIYGDMSYLTSNAKVGIEVLNLFDLLSGRSYEEDYKYLIVAPKLLKSEILKRITREINSYKKTGEGYIAFKLNGLIDKDIIQALYLASIAGVKIDLNIRGLCCLRPGIRNVSDNISVISIVGRFLEHARLLYFRNGGNEEMLLGSADMMPRNLTRRVEVLFSVPDKRIRRSMMENMLNIHLLDNVKSRRLLPDGRYMRVRRNSDEPVINSQNWLIENKGIWHDFTKSS
ncbi:polyphosphate kinase 1 [[Eubacterium] cellulosolvens]